MKDKVGLKIEIQYYSLVIKARLLTCRFQLTWRCSNQSEQFQVNSFRKWKRKEITN